MQYPKKLNISGFTHTVILVAAVVLTGIGGSLALILTHADSLCPVSGPVSGATSAPTSGTCSAPVSGPSATVSCSVQNVNTQYHPKGTIAPGVTIQNSGTSTAKNLSITAQYFRGNVLAVTDNYIAVANIGAGKSRTTKLPTISASTLGAGTNYSLNIYGASSTGNFYCSKTFQVLTK